MNNIKKYINYYKDNFTPKKFLKNPIIKILLYIIFLIIFFDKLIIFLIFYFYNKNNI